jgi:hypothetical protein
MNYGVKASFEIWGLLVPSFGSQPRRELTCRFTPESMGRQSSSPEVGQVISTIVIISASSPPSSRLVSSPPLSSCTTDLASAATSACPRITTQHRHRRQPRALPRSSTSIDAHTDAPPSVLPINSDRKPIIPPGGALLGALSAGNSPTGEVLTHTAMCNKIILLCFFIYCLLV